MNLLPESVIINDDTMREGLQIESADITVAEKLRLLDALGETGAKVISIGSYGFRTRLHCEPGSRRTVR